MKRILRLTQATQEMVTQLAIDNTTMSDVIRASLKFSYEHQTGKLDMVPGEVSEKGKNVTVNHTTVNLEDEYIEIIKKLSVRWNTTENKSMLTAIILFFYEDMDVIKGYLTDTSKPRIYGGRPRKAELTQRISLNVPQEDYNEMVKVMEKLGLGGIRPTIRFLYKQGLNK